MKKGYTHISIVLDRSGSMSSVADDTIGGFNTFLSEQQKLPGSATLSMIQFDTQFDTLYEVVEISKVEPLSASTFVPRGSTALLDAIGRSIADTGATLDKLADDDKPEKVIFVIITDGQENSSREMSRQQIFEMITHQKEKYAWDFLFLGANQDAIAVGGSYGISASAVLDYAGDPHGTRAVYNTMSKSVGRTRMGVTGQSVFTDEERAEQDELIKKGSK